jgi:hypothetical protein
MTRLLLLLGSLLLLSACAPALAPVQRAALYGLADELDAQLTPAGQLAATAALIAAERGQFPTSPFELLGSPQALVTGARNLNLSELTLTPEGEGVRLTYILLPRRDDPTDRIGSMLVRDAGDQYEAQVALTRRDDPDHTGRPLDIAERDMVMVRRLDGRLCIDLAEVRREGPPAEVPLDGRPYTITFTPSPGSGAARYPEIARGYRVTVGG